MLNIVRRGPASTATSLFSSSLCLRCVKAARPRYLRSCIPKVSSPIAIRAFRSTRQWKQRNAALAAAYEDEAIDGELEQEVHAEEPPSDAHINRAINYGPVTKFQELSERGMVCPTVVDTITKGMGLETMTQVQSLTINETLKGIDV